MLLANNNRGLTAEIQENPNKQVTRTLLILNITSKNIFLLN